MDYDQVSSQNVPKLQKMFTCSLLLSYNLNFQKMPPREFSANPFLKISQKSSHAFTNYRSIIKRKFL